MRNGVLNVAGAQADSAPASAGIEHAVLVLSLVLEREPLVLAAYRALLSEDENLRGTALEYLERAARRGADAGLQAIGLAQVETA
ncbi:MAG: hypothetical protein U0263_22940 [Polyangiaceae bacterium]